MDAMPFTVSGMTDRKHDSKEPVESRPPMKAKISGFFKRHEEKIVTVGLCNDCSSGSCRNFYNHASSPCNRLDRCRNSCTSTIRNYCEMKIPSLIL